MDDPREAETQIGRANLHTCPANASRLWRLNSTLRFLARDPCPRTTDRSLALLARYRNSLQPANRLTPDILILIFQVVVGEYQDPYNDSFGSYPWKGFAQVCNFWRTVALTSPHRQENVKPIVKQRWAVTNTA